MKYHKESFDTMTPGYTSQSILSDKDTNLLSDPQVDEINSNIKEELNNLLKQIKAKQKIINSLQIKINKEAIIVASNLNDKLYYSGKNIYFNNIRNIDVYSFLNPVGILVNETYTNLVNSKQIYPPKKSGDFKFIGGNNKPSQESFERGLYSIGNIEEMEGKPDEYYITIPLRLGTGIIKPVLLTSIKDAAFRNYTADTPNFNCQFLFGRKESPVTGKPYENLNSIDSKLIDFNLSYLNQLPPFLASANFLSVGYNGHIYVGIDVKGVQLLGPISFLTELINNHFGDKIGEDKGRTGFFMESKFFGNQVSNISNEVYEKMAESAEATSNWQQIIGKNWKILNKINLERIADEESKSWKLIANIDKSDAAGAIDAIQNQIVYFGMLTVGDKILGPSVKNIKNSFLDGGLKSSYLGCFKDRPERAIPNYRGVLSHDECQKIAHEEGAVIYALQDGGPGGVGRQNFTNGQCFIGNKSLNQYNPCLSDLEKLGEAAINFEEKKYGLNKTEKGQSWPAMCPTNNCKGNPKIGGPWTNAVYLSSVPPPVLGCQLILIGFGEADLPGTLKYIYREGKEQKSVIIWQPSIPLDQTILLPYTVDNTGDSNTGKDGITSINNFDQGPQIGETINFIWGGSNRYKFLYSSDYFFRLELNSKMSDGSAKVGFMNSSNIFKEENKNQSNYNSLLDFNSTGIKCIVNSNIGSWSNYNINSLDPRINKLFSLLNIVNPNRDLTSAYGNYSIVYTMRPIENKYLGRMGFIEYNTKTNSKDNPFNIKLYPEEKLKYKSGGPAKFIKTPGTIDPNFMPLWANEIGLTKKVKKINSPKQGGFGDSEINCAKACYNNLNSCHAYDYTKDNVCYNYLSETNDSVKLLEAQAVNSIFGPNLTTNKFHIRVPDVDNAETCPNSITDPLLTSAIPDLTDVKPSSKVQYKDINTKLYYNLEETNDLSLCNVGKIINKDELLLKSLQDELLKLANQYDSLVTNLEGKEKIIYQKLISKENLLNSEMKKLNKIQSKLENQEGNTPDTLNQQIDDSVYNLINNNYNFIIWTILAIGIIIAAIHFGRNIKKK